MFWIKDIANDLVNLARAHVVLTRAVVKDSDKCQVAAWFGSDGESFERILRVGTPAECNAFRDEIFLKLKEAQDSDRV